MRRAFYRFFKNSVKNRDIQISSVSLWLQSTVFVDVLKLLQAETHALQNFTAPIRPEISVQPNLFSIYFGLNCFHNFTHVVTALIHFQIKGNRKTHQLDI